MILKLVLKRTIYAALTLLLVSALVFAILEILPGDVATRILGRDATPESLAALRVQLNLNEPAIIRYFHWLSQILQGDLGAALTSQRPISEILAPRITNTVILSVAALAVSIPLTVIPAVIQAGQRYRAPDHALSVVTLILLSIPDFLLATLLLIAFVIYIPILPAVSLIDSSTTVVNYLRALVLPAVTLGIVMAVYGVRMLRGNLIEVLESEYIKMAELKGLSRRRVIIRHALPNALIPTLNIMALNLGYLIGGVVVVERIFGFPGFGSLLVDSLQLRDLPLIEATILISAAVYIAANLLSDVSAVLLNPRLKAA
jgi:peptide/nickel transport system permease protein